jgi:hypothetical protein
MNASLEEITNERGVTMDQIGMFDPSALPIVLECVERFVGAKVA